MNDKKEIEIQKMIEIVEKVFSSDYSGDYESGIRDFATRLIQNNAKILPENSVVLSKEEYSQLVNIKKFSETADRSLRVGNLLVYLEEFKEEVRKETAKSLLSELVYVTKIFHGDNSNILVWVEEKVKQFGVEVEE